MVREKKEVEKDNTEKGDNPLEKVETVPPLTILKYANDQTKKTSVVKKGEKRNGS
jgi:hypothetical protein